MELNSIKRVYLIGIGGIGMSGLARYFNHRGCLVAGYDKTQTPLTTALEQENIEVAYHDEIDYIPYDFNEQEDGTLVIYTPAIPANSLILSYFQDKKFVLKKRSEVLGIISKGMFTIAVAGTHGKTTTSSMVAHILRESGNDCSAFLGGIATNYQTNVLFGSNEIVVVEADEYDRSFLTLHPDIAVVTSMDADHLDIYGDKNSMVQSFQQFASQLKPDGKLIAKKGLPLNGITYSVDENAAVSAENISIKNGSYYFDFKNEEIEIKDIQLGIAGIHNVENAVAAIQTALFLEVDSAEIKAALKSFLGIKRRFEYIINTNKNIYIDDYAHHPEELRAAIASVKVLYPQKKLTVIFQPHLFTRTRDFADEFAAVLAEADDLLMLDIYPARELPIEGVDAQMILDRIKSADNKKYTIKEALDYVQQNQPELLLTVGAGDIDKLVEPLKNILQHV
ncbi:MAG: UDP-N-acetylmuramate--L-alanine ligase [Janthinobacterium lividum]